MKISKLLFLLGVLGFAVAFSPGKVLAQTWPEVTEHQSLTDQNPVSSEYQVWVYKPRNVLASMLAWLADPYHNEIPPEYRVNVEWKAHLAGRSLRDQKKVGLGNWRSRFDGLQAIIPQDDQQQLLVMGTHEGIRRAASYLSSLDQLWRQIEVEVQFVETDPEDMRAAGADVYSFAPGSKSRKAPGVGKQAWSMQQVVQDLVAAGKAKVLSTQRMTLINDVSGFIGSGYTLPATVGIKDEKGRSRKVDVEPTTADAAQLQLGVQPGFQILVTITDIGTLWLVMKPARRFDLSVAGQQLPLKSLESGGISIDIGNGYPVAISGATYAGTVQDAIGGGRGKNVVVIVSAKVVKRAGEK